MIVTEREMGIWQGSVEYVAAEHHEWFAEYKEIPIVQVDALERAPDTVTIEMTLADAEELDQEIERAAKQDD